MRALCLALAALCLLPGCVVTTAAGLAGDVVEGTAKTAVFTVKTTGKVAGAALPGGGDEDADEDRDEAEGEKAR